jgi:hypothetical protein
MHFLNPGALWFLWLMFIPVIIHLFQFRRYKKTPFTRVDLLRLIVIKTGFGNKLRKWLTMLVRMLAIAMVVLAFSKPYIGKKIEPLNDGNKICSIYIDNSPTLLASGSEGVLLESAKNRARSIIRDLPDVYRFFIMDNGGHDDVAIPKSKEEALEGIDKMSILNHREDINNVIASLNEISGKEGISVLISDFRSPFVSSVSEKHRAAMSYWVKLPSFQNDNLSIDSVWLESPSVMPEQQTKLNVKVTNHGKEQVSNITMKLFQDQLLKASSVVDIEGENHTISSLNFNPGSEGWKNITLSLPGDMLNHDDAFFVSLQVQKNSHVLLLNEQKKSPFLSTLLNEKSGFKTWISAPVDMPYGQLNTSDVLIMDGIAEMSSGLLQEVKKFVDNGGSLIMFPPNETATSYSTMLKNLGINSEVVWENIRVETDMWDVNHPIFRGILQKSPSQSKFPMVRKYVSHSGLSGATHLWKLKNGAPFISMLSMGRGTIFMSSVGLDTSFSDLPLNYFFVPFMLRMTAYKASMNPLYAINYSDKPYPVSVVNLRSPQSTLRMKGHSIEWIPELVILNDQYYVDIRQKVDLPGFYPCISSEDSLISVMAFNINPSLSVTSVPTMAQLQEYALEAAAQLLEDKPDYIGKNWFHQPSDIFLWKVFLMIGCLLLLLEMVMLKHWKM